jgi:hypothetical protein
MYRNSGTYSAGERRCSGTTRSIWTRNFVDYILAKFLDMSYLKVQPGQILSIFLQDVHIAISPRTPLPDEIKRMIRAVRKYKLKFTAL